MKKLTGILAALVLFISASSFAPGDEVVSSRIKSVFEKTFTSASEVTWNKSDGFYFAKFKINEQVLSAAFDEEGALLGATRNIDLSQLPLSISLALQNRFPNYSIIESVTEMTIGGETNYYVTAENSKRILSVKASATGDITIERKTKKT